MTGHNLIIQNGRVIDPHNGIDEITDVVIENGHILKLGAFNNVKFEGWPSLDASGCVVTPGLVDCHVHAYEHATPLGINVDRSCLARGVTAVVDAGSAGWCSTRLGKKEHLTFIRIFVSTQGRMKNIYTV